VTGVLGRTAAVHPTGSSSSGRRRPLALRLLTARARAWLLLGHQGGALALFDRVLARWPDDPHALASRAHLRAQAGGTALALEDAQRLVGLTPEDARAWFNLGFLREAAGHWPQALSAFERATALNPRLDRAWYGQGLVLIRLQRYDEAVLALEQNTRLQPMSPCGWYQLARVHLDRGEPVQTLNIIGHLRGFEPRVAAQLERETGLPAGGAA